MKARIQTEAGSLNSDFRPIWEFSAKKGYDTKTEVKRELEHCSTTLYLHYHNDQAINVAGVNGLPGAPIPNYGQALGEILQENENEGRLAIVCGDFNITVSQKGFPQ